MLLYKNINNHVKRYSTTGIFMIILLLIQFHTNEVQAIQAFRSHVKYKLDDGSIVPIQLRGDEDYKWAICEDGYTLLYAPEGKLVYAMLDSLNQTIASSWQLAPFEKRSGALSAFLNKIPKNLSPKFNNQMKGGERQQQNTISSSRIEPITGYRKALVILMNFTDVKFTKSREDFDELFNRIGYTEDHAKGSVRDFYRECSSGQLDLSCNVIGPYSTNYNRSYYGSNGLKGGSDNNPEALFKEAIQAASSVVNFSDYDVNNDGYIDNVHIIFAGYGEESGAASSAIWSHEQTLSADVYVQGLKTNTYSCAPELRANSGNGISRIGVHCHEMGHLLGAMDFYDTDGPSGAQYEGTGQWDIMASGSWNEDGVSPPNFNPFVRVYTFGWAVAQTKSGLATLYPTNQSENQVYRLDTSMPGEFFLLENRQQSGFDRALPGHGLLIYHINSQMEGALETNTLNSTHPQLCYPVCASSTYAIPSTSPASYGDINSAGCPFPGSSKKSAFTDHSIPSAQSWTEEYSGITLANIVENESGEINLRIGLNDLGYSNGTIFSENFETGIFTAHWEHIQPTSIQGWKISSDSDYRGLSAVTTLDGLLVKPINGEHYMYLKASSLKTGNSTATVILKDIGLKVGQSAKLSFIYQNISVSKLTNTSILKIYTQKRDQDNRMLLATLTDSKREWTPFVINLPNLSESGIILFEGDISAGDIYVDDILIQDTSISTKALDLKINPTLLKCWNYDSGIVAFSEITQYLQIHTIEGKLYQDIRIQPGETRIPLPHGFYIVSVKNCRCKVVV